jgi:hypothetical protein
MIRHSLGLEPELNEHDVLCVTTSLPSYLFVFFLNRMLGLGLYRSATDLIGEPANTSFAIYEYTCPFEKKRWKVVENKYLSFNSLSTGSLFAASETQSLLFKETPQSDLLICVDGLTDLLIKNIQSIRLVVSCFRLPKKINFLKEKLSF